MERRRRRRTRHGLCERMHMIDSLYHSASMKSKTNRAGIVMGARLFLFPRIVFAVISTSILFASFLYLVYALSFICFCFTATIWASHQQSVCVLRAEYDIIALISCLFFCGKLICAQSPLFICLYLSRINILFCLKLLAKGGKIGQDSGEGDINEVAVISIENIRKRIFV